MLNKEIKDTLILFAGLIAMVLFTLGSAFLMVHLLVDRTFPFADFAPLLIYMDMMGVSFYLGISLFSEEKSERSFEYLFSLRYSRGKILFNKILPRLTVLLVIMGLYALLSSVIRPFPVPSGWLITILLYFFLFLSAASMSLLHKNHLTNLVYALGIYMISYGIFAIVIIQLQGLGREVIFSIIRIAMILVFLVSLFIFSAFWHYFKKADLGNFTRLFGKSLLSGLKFIGIPILALFLIWILINRFDAAEIEGEFKLSEKPTTHYGKENGFYRLWTLSEAPRINVDSDRVVMKYRHLFDPKFENEKYLQAWDHQAYRAGYAKYHRLRASILRDTVYDLDWGTTPANSLVRKIFNSRNRIFRLRDEYTVFLERYEKLMTCTLFEDITLLRHDSPIPNLVAWLHISKLHDWLCVLDAREGNWDRAIERLINHIDFIKRVLKGSRVLIINLVAKGVMRYSLQYLASLMNQRECPPRIYNLVLDRVQPVSTEDMGSRIAMQADYISMADYVDRNLALDRDNLILRIAAALFFQKNRTKKYIFEPYRDVISLEELPPYQWKTGLDEIRKKYSKKKSGIFRWVRNPYGKYLAEQFAIPNLLGTASKTYHTRALIDMIRISAELHLNYDAEKPMEEILKSLNSFKAMDPCSGKPYKWNPDKQVLYSLGVDRDDDNGTVSYNTNYDTDYILPIVLTPRS